MQTSDKMESSKPNYRWKIPKRHSYSQIFKNKLSNKNPAKHRDECMLSDRNETQIMFHTSTCALVLSYSVDHIRGNDVTTIGTYPTSSVKQAVKSFKLLRKQSDTRTFI